MLRDARSMGALELALSVGASEQRGPPPSCCAAQGLLWPLRPTLPVPRT